jgi:protein-tyrosine phosphatase
MWTELHWLPGPWQGKLALAARSRGGEWLADEITNWRRAGIDGVLSLLEPHEEIDLELESERREAESRGMEFLSFPIPDRGVPDSEALLESLLEELIRTLTTGKHIVIHCRQGIGRTGLVAACLLLSNRLTPEEAVRILSAARGVAVPETPEQRLWIDRYARIS